MVLKTLFRNRVKILAP